MPTPPKLKAYRAKREFTKTPEPAGGLISGDGNRFVVHKHHATADHYDLRLQVGGVLKSWAVPRGPSLNPADKRLAVETEDHPLEYIDFEGVIPEGEYGGGPMIVWDTGTWAPMDDVDKSLRTGAFKFRLAGDKLNGGWMLTRLKPKPGEDSEKKNWLLFKERDLAADTGLDILEARPESVKSGKRIEELVAPPRKPARLPPKPGALKPGALSGAVRGDPPSRIEPQLATQVPKPPGGPVEDTGELWLHEIKFDGYRTMAHVGDGEVRLITRGGIDWTKRYGDLPQAFSRLPLSQAIIDGEIMVLDEKGISRFALLQDALSAGAGSKLHFYAFDLLHLDGWDLRKAPLARRKALLAELLAGQGANSAIQLSDHVEGDGQGLYDQASILGLEGVVSKRANAIYQSGRTKTWTKVKALETGDFIIAGYTVSDAAEGLAAIGMAEFADGELHYRGKVGTGFDAATAGDLLARLQPLRDGATAPEGVPREIMREMKWVRPMLSARIHYANRTADNSLRHGVFRGLRDVGLSTPVSPKRKRLIAEADLATIWVTNPERRLFGKTGPTKLDIAVYYALVGDFMLPHIMGRPVSLVRCPTGLPKDCFFQRHAFTGMPPSVVTFDATNSEGETKSCLSVEGAKGYLALAQFGVVEFHTWGTHRLSLDKPDQIVFDLDPGEGIAWREVVEAAVHIKGELERFGLVPFAKTSGGSGIHITVPVTQKQNWKKLHQATSAISTHLAATAPDTFTTTMGKENRKRRIFIDYHRNARGHTSAAPYSLRARTNLPASTPVSWSDLETIDAPQDLNYSSLPGLLATSGDPWADMEDFARDLPVFSGK
ncbi:MULTISPECIES: DNA ligase D [unclassified Mesorhizobium]|uniref:DNA ligase D n=1 Tax=unclassified Mesorhizobium TaxID=325217 RepID=UPI0003CDFD6B|nr:MULTISPECIES: DNA ligase D [unclassified Mesorhizobium]ESX59847.1 ATP-dependent DNA ligase [Mesorhizobium sp. LSHC422A00]ESY54051.1 ATP-dependent DNA ligase [Mesorhizobium sp. LNJC374B00]ESY59190.1 ATP-dependent DNA ligase [Mesorhizobium sp. LNJC372A00]WJI79855.1 DNA ligase D [Mesorhizobium sp. C374B]WJI86391.1 DNA ligase D [Mesorhizobium sp. C372A]